jgi:hypothetical protein
MQLGRIEPINTFPGWKALGRYVKKGEKAMKELNITVEPFEHPDGNCQGYAKTDQRVIAVSPIAYDGFKTAAHECSHVLLHPRTVSSDSENLKRDLKDRMFLAFSN